MKQESNRQRTMEDTDGWGGHWGGGGGGEGYILQWMDKAKVKGKASALSAGGRGLLPAIPGEVVAGI